MTDARPKLIIANWKQNLNRAEALALVEELRAQYAGTRPQVAIAPVATMLHEVGRALQGSGLVLTAQNVSKSANGAFTGEVGGEHLAEQGVQFCIIGHSERRQYFGETDEDVGEKALQLLSVGITPVCCVGESLAERKEGLVDRVLVRQCAAIFAKIASKSINDLVLAYEPIWAIGTGQAATAADAAFAHGIIRTELRKHLGETVAKKARILYGGSVTQDNIASFCNQTNIDGALVGKASLQIASFLSMVGELGGLDPK
jgi:triosephosphate isomerase